jgi:hypothetical protein
MNPYEQIAQFIIEKFMLVVGGAIAVERARKVSDLTVDDNGKITAFTGDDKTVIALIEQYQELLGPAGISFARDAARPVVTQNPKLLFPDILRSRDELKSQI